jgi:hypothetical protein
LPSSREPKTGYRSSRYPNRRSRAVALRREARAHAEAMPLIRDQGQLSTRDREYLPFLRYTHEGMQPSALEHKPRPRGEILECSRRENFAWTG